jgi:choline transport protein
MATAGRSSTALERGGGIELAHRQPLSTGDKQIPDSVEYLGNDVPLHESEEVYRVTKSSNDDIRGMRRMGKEQQLVRNFRLLSITSFVALATASWEIGLFIITPALIDGGSPGLLWSSLWSWIGFLPIYLSMAEMASMAPICGAQYHWVSGTLSLLPLRPGDGVADVRKEFAPAKYQRFLSYIAG